VGYVLYSGAPLDLLFLIFNSKPVFFLSALSKEKKVLGSWTINFDP
jgi:hypothetical protein